MDKLSRRRVVQLLAATPILPTLSALGQVETQNDALGYVLPTRPLGNTGEHVTMLGVGGSHVGGINENQVQEFIDLSIELGVRFFDTAEAYQRGGSERYFGRFLTPRYREHIYLMTKSGARDAATARRHLDESRRRMNVDVIDLWQVHTIEDNNDVNRRFDQGVIDVFLEAREQGIVRHIGFTGHSLTDCHLLFLDRLEQMGVEFDATQMPINVVDTQYDSFIDRLVPRLVEKNYGILAMKTLAAGRLFGNNEGWGNRPQPPSRVIPDRMSLDEALGYVWSQPIATLISGMNNMQQLRENAGLARRYQALNEEQALAIHTLAEEGGGQDMEFYKDGGP